MSIQEINYIFNGSNCINISFSVWNTADIKRKKKVHAHVNNVRMIAKHQTYISYFCLVRP